MKRLVLVLCAWVLTSPAYAQDRMIEAREWMLWPHSERVAYITGSLETAESLAKSYGKKMKSTIGRKMTFGELEEILFRRLIREPELRRGAIIDVMWEVLGPLVATEER